MHGTRKEEPGIVSRQSNKALLSQAGATCSKGIEASCAGLIDESEKEGIEDDPAEAETMFEEKHGEINETKRNEEGICREKANKLMKQMLEEGIVTKATICQMEDVGTIENGSSYRHLSSSLETMSVLNEGISNTATSEAEDQIAEQHDRSMDQYVGRESSNCFFQISLAAEQVGAKYIPTYAQYLLQSHLSATPITYSVPEKEQRPQESVKNGQGNQQGDNQHMEQSVQCGQRTFEANNGTTSRLICDNDDRDPDNSGHISSNIICLQPLLSSKIPRKYERQEGKGDSVLCSSVSVSRLPEPYRPLQEPLRRKYGRSLRRIGRRKGHAARVERKAGPQGGEAKEDRILDGQDFGDHVDGQDFGDHVDVGRVQELAAALGDIVWNLQE